MSQQEILEQIKTLKPKELFEIAEAALRLMAMHDLLRMRNPLARAEIDRRMREAAEIAAPYYENDKELTLFTELNTDDFLDPEEYIEDEDSLKSKSLDEQE